MAKAKQTFTFLDDLMNSLSEAILKHSERTKELSKLVIKHVECEEWFLKEIEYPDSLADAIYYHDIGKSKLKKEYLYRDLCLNPNDLHRYYEHTNLGLEIVESDNAKNIEDDYMKYISAVVRYHHLKEKKPVAAVVAFIADFFDNKCYPLKISNKGELTNIKFEFFYNEMLSELDKASVSKKIIKFLKNQEFIDKFYKFVDMYYNENDDGNHYGINLKGINIYDIFQSNTVVTENAQIPFEEHLVFGTKLTYALMNRYYGEVRHKDFVYFAMKHKFALKLDNFFLDNLKEFFDKYSLDKTKYLFIDMSITSLNKNVIKKVNKILMNAEFPVDKVVFSFDLFASELDPLYVENLEIVKSFGYKIAINNIRTNVIDILKQQKFEFAFYDNVEANSVDSMFAELVQSLGTTMILTRVSAGQYRYICGEEKRISDLVTEKVGDLDG